MRKTSLDNQLVFLDRKRNLYVYKRKGGDSVVERAPSIFGFLAVVMLLAISRVFDHADLFEPSGGYKFDTLADDLNEVIERLDLHCVTLVGHSMGAWSWSVICRGMVLAASLGSPWLLPIRL
jgi:pimeloyl-ACP methyl ester carboxylesterase